MCVYARYEFPTLYHRCCVTLQPLVHSVSYIGDPQAKFGDRIYFRKKEDCTMN